MTEANDMMPTIPDFDTPPITLTIAGSDSGGGAGIQADLKTFSALGVYGASVITAVTAQNTRAVTAVHEIPAAVVAAQIRAVLDDLEVRAIKIGMLFSPAIIDAVAQALQDTDIPLVLDPVMIAKSGDALLQEDAMAAMIEQLFPRATLITPNLPEAARLVPHLADAAPRTQAEALLALGPRNVLLKGGHGAGTICTDLLLGPDGATELQAERQKTRNTHGTGCTYSAAIASGLAQGLDLTTAVRRAHDYLQAAITAADQLRIGSGHGPVHHFHALWPTKAVEA
ncbi:bifunctional hydroxymethylpyrimidine kinase/phosphomethylpyrimidine kinase [Puniceibacterium sp. IMCC21224]|uniref:bifunctional hydroxymethylpyrimidine kinase/phosphomethylpyrimidine kinase n=1 Tax=Puniceibacterium sp. IMCC21224 TaxID=1618204 RepID=UPI00065D54A7|nr:bifunctional hydroxymethylpyrimidine kinase/phosphomethylpyrimidine kinase [Puniceibacterium sp. IMCC21224]KMK66201.1 hydroxymethylpyrimidine kinase [Puniceibacterium sp. IMCC21224]